MNRNPEFTVKLSNSDLPGDYRYNMRHQKKQISKRLALNVRHSRAWSENLSFVMQLGLTMAGCIFFCFFIGRLIDTLLKTKGIFLTIFIFLGVIGGANVVYRQIMEMVAPEQSKDKRSGHLQNGTD